MRFDIRPLGPGAAEIGPIDLSKPVSPEAAAALHRVFADYPVLVLRDQALSARQVADFGRLFGALERYAAPPAGAAPPTAALPQTDRRATPDQRLYACPEDEAVLLMTNEVRIDLAPLAIIDNAETWHADGSHKAAPYQAVAVHVVRNPTQGGDTEFCDLRALYDALPENVQNGLIDRVAAHHWSKSRNPRFATALTPEAFAEGERVAAMFPETLQPVVCQNAPGDRPHLFLSPRFTLRVEGFTAQTSTTLLENLFALMEEPVFIYRHEWRDGDLVLWDNRRTNHRVRAYSAEDVRSRYRITISGQGRLRPYTRAA